MSVKTHYTAAGTFTPASGITKGRVTVAGGAGDPDSLGRFSGGPGAILQALVSLGSSLSVSPGNVAGGARGRSGDGAGGYVYGGKGGSASTAGDIVAGAGSGACAFANGAAGGVPGVDAPSGSIAGGTVAPGGGKADGTGGVAGVNSGTASAGQSHAAGGQGGAGLTSSSAGAGCGGGGAGYSGGGGGALSQSGGAGSSSGGTAGATLVGYNAGTPYVDVEVAGVPKVATYAGATGVVDGTAAIRLALVHNPDTPGDVLDVQTGAQFRYRIVGSGSWTQTADLGTATVFDIAANTLTIGSQYEVQCRSAVDDGVWGPWSDSSLFTPKTPPATPTVTSPETGATIGTARIVAEWSSTGQVQYQLRAVGDTAGVANATVYADTGTVTGTAQADSLTVAVNDVDAHVQLRYRTIAGELWSAWADVPVSILWEPPPVARVTRAIDEKRGSIIVAIVNPTPEGVQPDASVNRVFITEGGVEQAPVLVAPSTTWTYWTPVGDVGVRVEAVDESTGVLSSTGVIW